MISIFVVDDNPSEQKRFQRLLSSSGYRVHSFNHPQVALTQAIALQPDLVICGAQIQGRSGLSFCGELRKIKDLATVFFILLSPTLPLSTQERIQSLEVGIDDFFVPTIPLSQLLIRIQKGVQIRQLRQELQQQKRIFDQQRNLLDTELKEAANYVRSILPEPFQYSPNHNANSQPLIAVEHCFIPSQQLGGDGFDYTLLDGEKYLIVYLLDVAGHGLRAALPSISIINLLRSQKLRQGDYHNPSSVLQELNQIFQTNKISDKYFTIWYGIFDLQGQTLTFASAGHPPALLLSQDAQGHVQSQRLTTQGLPVGIFPQAVYQQKTIQLHPPNSLYIFSDGIYEIDRGNSNYLGFEEFASLLEKYHKLPERKLEFLLDSLKHNHSQPSFADDLAIVQVDFWGNPA
jgi:sigma-B regulation protein RsbU (phosphoserine phosphatase)